MANELFTVSKGDRSDKPNVLLVLTDGRPNLPRGEDFDYGLLDNINGQLKVLATWQWRIQGMLEALLFLNNLGTPPPPSPEKILDQRASPLSQGLDSALLDVMFRVCVYVT